MKKTLFASLFLLMIALDGVAQQWEIDILDKSNQSPYTIIDAGTMDANGNAILIGRQGRYRDSKTLLIKVFPDGSHAERICDELPNTLKMCDVVQLENGNFFTVGTQWQDTLNPLSLGGQRLWTVVFDPYLAVVEAKPYVQDTVSYYIEPNLFLDDDGTVVACGAFRTRRSTGNSWRQYPYLYRFNSNADTLACRYVMPGETDFTHPEFPLHSFYCNRIMKQPTGNGYAFLCNGPFGGLGMACYDAGFQYQNSFRFMLQMPQCPEVFALGDEGYADWLTDNQLLFFGTRSSNSAINSFHLCLAHLETNGTVSRYEEGFCHQTVPYRDEITSKGKSMAVVNDSTIFGSFMTETYPSGELQLSAGICLFDRNLEVLGDIEFDAPEYQNFYSRFVLPVGDDGCLLVLSGGSAMGLWYNECKGKIIKLLREDFNPIPTEVNEMLVDETQFTFHPNPTNGVLFVETRHGTSLPTQTYRITNLMGQTLMTGQITSETEQIDVSGLPDGMYFITVGGTTRKFVVR